MSHLSELLDMAELMFGGYCPTANEMPSREIPAAIVVEMNTRPSLTICTTPPVCAEVLVQANGKVEAER